MMVLVKDRISARQETLSMTILQINIVTDVASRPPVMEEVTEGEHFVDISFCLSIVS